MKMSTNQVRNAIMDLLVRELPQGTCSFEELGGKIEVILNFFPFKKGQKDKYAPKKTRTAYTFFCQKNRPETMERMKKTSEDGVVKSVDIVRALAEKWSRLKQECDAGDVSALAEMSEYKTQSMEDMGRYQAECEAYKEKMLRQ